MHTSERRTMPAVGVSVAVLAGAIITLATAAAAAEHGSAGKTLYLRHCSACHGASGRGDGVVSGFVTPRPTDLTQIATKAGGAFPSAKVAQSIDGTTVIGAHGAADMPVWGEVFRRQSAAALTKGTEARSKVMLITEYLRSIQQQ